MPHHSAPRPPLSRRPVLAAHPRATQRGASLFTVFILLLLTLLLVLGGMRVGIFNESIVGNQADIQRANAAAEALMQHAANSIYEQGPHCSLDKSKSDCRFPRNEEEFTELATNLANQCGAGAADSSTPKGICMPVTPDARVFQTDYIMTKPRGARDDIQMRKDTALSYSDFAGSAKAGDTNLGLSDKGQYWVEIFRYSKDLKRYGQGQVTPAPGMPLIEPDASYPFISRITVRAQGLKDGSQVTRRSFYVPVVEQAIQTAAPTPAP